MAANGISTLPDKEDRRDAKLALAVTERQTVDTPGYRVRNVLDLVDQSNPSYPWKSA